MNLALFFGVVLLVIISGLLCSAALLWLSSKLVRIADSSFRRALLAVLVLTFLQLLLGAALIAALQWEPVVGLALELASLVLTIAVLKGMLRASIGKTILAWLIWAGLSIPLALGMVFVLKLGVMEAFVIPTGGMADF